MVRPQVRGSPLPLGGESEWPSTSDAIHELRMDDGVLIPVRNSVLARRPKGRAFSTVQLTAPEGRDRWLNDFVYVGTLDSLRPQRQAVLIRVYQVL
jgi:hypothetical protein